MMLLRTCQCQFQSTHPARGATQQTCAYMLDGSDFNPRTPRGVRHADGERFKLSEHDFNPRTPRGVRPRMAATLTGMPEISIHAPREGCDMALDLVMSRLH